MLTQRIGRDFRIKSLVTSLALEYVYASVLLEDLIVPVVVPRLLRDARTRCRHVVVFRVLLVAITTHCTCAGGV